MSYRTVPRYLAIIALCFLLANPTYGRRHDLKIAGKIIAIEWQASDLFMLTDVPDRKTLIVRIDKIQSGSEKSSYVRVRYDYLAPATKSTADIFDLSKIWELNLVRNTTCDGSLARNERVKKVSTTSDGNQELPFEPVRWVVESEREKIAPDQILPCFQLHEGDFQVAKI